MAQVAGKQQKSDFGEVPPKPSPGGKPEVHDGWHGLPSLFLVSSPPRELFPFLGPLEQISFWFGLTQSGEKPARARVATAQARPDGVGEGPERVYASMGPAPPPRRP